MDTAAEDMDTAAEAASVVVTAGENAPAARPERAERFRPAPSPGPASFAPSSSI